MIGTKSVDFKLAPPTSAPFTFVALKISVALLGFTEPPYNIEIFCPLLL